MLIVHVCCDKHELYISKSHRNPLNLRINRRQPTRLNIVSTGFDKGVTGGPLSIMHFAGEAVRTGLNVRWINIDGYGMHGEEMRNFSTKHDFLAQFVRDVEFVFNAYNTTINCNPNDMFMSTYFFTSQISHFTIQANPLLNQRNFLYFIQDAEYMFFPHDSNYIEALESYRLPHFAIYSTPFLQSWFKSSQTGQYEFICNASSSNTMVEAFQFTIKPAIKKYPKLSAKLFSNPARNRTLIAYLRAHKGRNAYQLTMDALNAAICANFLDHKWKILGVGARRDYNVILGSSCNKTRVITVRQNIPEPQYQRIISSGDVGLSLMLTPHPSTPPLDFAAAGLITVTNSFLTKTAGTLRGVSSNFVVVQPFIENIVAGLRKAAALSSNLTLRQRGMNEFNWERNWTGPECFGLPLMRKLKSWQKIQQPLWTLNYESR
eukprot:gene33455-44804_t